MQERMGEQVHVLERTPGRRREAYALAPLLAVFFALLLVTPAHGSFHEMSIREVYPGGPDNASYVELQMWAGGQNFVAGHHLVAYDSTGNATEDLKFAANVASGANQATILVSDTSYPLVFDELPAPDETDAELNLSPTGGAVCWIEGSPPDCVAWGNFNGQLPSPAGSPAAPGGVPTGMALRRSIVPGCPTLLERSDDTNASATDLSVVSPSPRPNSVVPTERSCGPSVNAGQGGSGGSNGSSERGKPQTTLKRKPRRRTHDHTPTFRFGADERGSTFQCKLDGKPFKACRSPFTTKLLTFGPHTFKVRARDESGKLDPSPASYAFRVVPH
jgi:hypothetical protein